MKNYTVQSFSDNQSWDDETYTNLSTAIKECKANISNGAQISRVLSGMMTEGKAYLHYSAHADCTGGQYCTQSRCAEGEPVQW